MSNVTYGIVNEPVAIQKYEEERKLSVEPCGLFMQPQWPYLGASPDGLVGDDGLVEVKCIPKVGTLHPREAAAFPKFKLSVKLEGDKLVMIEGSDHYIQIQAQCNLADRSYCDLILFCDGGYEVCGIQENYLIMNRWYLVYGIWYLVYGIYMVPLILRSYITLCMQACIVGTYILSVQIFFQIIRVERNTKYWENEMLPKLKQFFLECMLPEIIDSRHRRGLPIRDPKFITDAMKLKKPNQKTPKQRAKKKKNANKGTKKGLQMHIGLKPDYITYEYKQCNHSSVI